MSRARKTAAKPAAKNERKETKATAKAASAPAKAKGMSLLAAAIEVLKASDEPLNCRQMVAAAKERGLWTPGMGKTPEQTLYSSIKREIAARGDASRFVVSPSKGHFAYRAS